jgi:hypothetical protein
MPKLQGVRTIIEIKEESTFYFLNPAKNKK